MRDGRTDDEQGKIGLLSLWKAEFRYSTPARCERVAQGWETLLLNGGICLMCGTCLPLGRCPPQAALVSWCVFWVPSGAGGDHLVPQSSVSCLACFLTGLTATCAHLLFLHPDSSIYMCSVAMQAFFD